jgi:Mn2+/Fe2+ NRAMP family transporter
MNERLRGTSAVDFQRSRRGSAQDRGKLLRFPGEAKRAVTSHASGWGHNLRRLGPAVVTGASDVDPSLVVTATVIGAAFHYNLLWLVVLCVPFLIAIFGVTGRIGYQAQRGLVDLLRESYGWRWAASCALAVVLINMAMIIADTMAVTDAFSIILGQKRSFFVAAVAFSVWYVLIYHDYRKVTRVLLVLALPLFVYVAAAIMSEPPWKEVLLRTVWPHVSRTPEYAEAIVALFGALLTPYVLIWQTSSRREHAVIGEQEPHGAEPHMGTFVTTVLCYSIIVAAGTVLHLPEPADMTTRQAAEALRPAVGGWGELLFAVGLIGAGMVALPILVASMCYSIAEAMGWKAGLSEHPWEAKRFYVLISAALLTGAAFNFIRINPVKALYWSMILAGILMVPILVFLLVLGNDRRVMCRPEVGGTTNTVFQNFWIGAAAGGLIAAGGIWAWWAMRG